MSLSVFNKNLYSFIIVIFTFGFDRITKNKIIENQLNDNRIFVNDYLNLELVWNTGIGFGLLNLEPNIYYHLISLLIFIIIFFLGYLSVKANLFEKTCFSLILGGAIGNFYDRIFYFGVPDFIDFHYEEFHWFTFNIADIFITLGVFVIILKECFYKK
jgi:signal peptidase II